MTSDCVSSGAVDPPATMTMDALETLNPHHNSALLLSESAAAVHFNVLSFDTCLYKSAASDCGGTPPPAAGPSSQASAPGDLNTPVTTSSDVPSFFGPSTVVEPPPITGN